MAEMLGDILAPPFPQAFNGIEVWAISRQRNELNAQTFGLGLDDLAAVMGSTIPDDHELTAWFVKLLCEKTQELDGILAITVPVLPEQAASVRKIIGTIPIKSLA